MRRGDPDSRPALAQVRRQGEPSIRTLSWALASPGCPPHEHTGKQDGRRHRQRFDHNLEQEQAASWFFQFPAPLLVELS